MSHLKNLIFALILFSIFYNILGRDDETFPNQFNNNIYSELEKLISNYTQQIAITAVSLDKNKTSFYLNSKKSFVSASMIKLLILCEFIDQIDNKNISLNDNYTYKDNIATNVLIDILGMDNINEKSKELGLNETKLNRKMMHWNGTENYINAEDTEFILRGLLYKKIGSAEMCERAINYLLENKDFDSIMRGLPKDVKCAHKSGSLDLIRHDGGIVYAENKYIIIILTKNFTDENDANYLMGNISEIVYNILGKESTPDTPTDTDGNIQTFMKIYIMSLILYLLLMI